MTKYVIVNENGNWFDMFDTKSPAIQSIEAWNMDQRGVGEVHLEKWVYSSDNGSGNRILSKVRIDE